MIRSGEKQAFADHRCGTGSLTDNEIPAGLIYAFRTLSGAKSTLWNPVWIILPAMFRPCDPDYQEHYQFVHPDHLMNLYPAVRSRRNLLPYAR